MIGPWQCHHAWRPYQLLGDPLWRVAACGAQPLVACVEGPVAFCRLAGAAGVVTHAVLSSWTLGSALPAAGTATALR